ncbi:hypothetical protein DYBT9623_05232 [Dyadobacter sp. CECT 9623]|uniref:Helix-turn-helix domain-containing protein n=1 Tax=Dyadobacter linearis TaxID=2823330 RepID=A0ABN7RIX5_9BACT|nr:MULTISPECIES: helix-turn-helix domain-containing protein [Dyadobacter]CAG5074545.1 hypothetical protein DYBT9623_05232 [Dyadobacter sp. CECT 9623]
MENPFIVIDQRLERIESLVMELRSNTVNATRAMPDKFVNITEAAQILELAVPTVYNLVSAGRIPVMKKSKRLYFSRKELLDYIRTGRRKTIEEIEDEARSYVANRQPSSARK